MKLQNAMCRCMEEYIHWWRKVTIQYRIKSIYSIIHIQKKNNLCITIYIIIHNILIWKTTFLFNQRNIYKGRGCMYQWPYFPHMSVICCVCSRYRAALYAATALIDIILTVTFATYQACMKTK